MNHFVFTALMLLSMAGYGASISGTASDAKGAIQGTVVITFTRTTPSADGPLTGAAGLGPDGKFEFLNLAVGTYALCVQGAGHNYVDGCAWQTPRLVEVKRANEKVTANIALETGVRMRFLLRDSKRLLQRPGRAGADGRVEIGFLMKNGMYQPVRKTAHEDLSATWEAVLPGNETFHLQLEPRRFRLRDKAGQAVPPGQRVSLAVATKSGETERLLEYSADVEGSN